MDKREKVINGLECCIEKLDTVTNKTHGFNCTACPYFKRCDSSGYLLGLPLMKDALALLKAQDETRLVRHYSRPNVYADLWLHCEKCGECVDDNWHPKYCPGCGRLVKWDD